MHQPDVRHAPVAMDADTFRSLGHRLIDELAAAMAAIPDGPVAVSETPAALRRALGLDDPLPAHGTDAAAILGGLVRPLFAHSLFNAHPRFWGYITAPPTPIGVLGELLAAGLNANVGAWALAPAASEIEAQVIRWIAELLNYPTDCGGLLLSGGNMANITALLAARAAKAGWNVREEGIRATSRPPLRIYCSTETHTWIQKAVDLAGFGTASLRWIPVGRDGRMDLQALRATLAVDRAAGDVPIAVIGTAGTVSTGAVDPLAAIADICEDQGIWFHVDGAYGGFAAAVPGTPSDLRAISRADSVAVDPHKWLYAPLDAGCVLVRHDEHLRQAFAYHPPYYHFDERLTNYAELGPENSRPFRALKIWLALRQAGASGYRQMIADDISLAGALAQSVELNPELELLAHNLSIVTFRYVPDDWRRDVGTAAGERRLDALNRAVLDRLQTGGEVFVSNAVVNGVFALRACIVNFHTQLNDVRALASVVVRAGRAVEQEQHAHAS